MLAVEGLAEDGAQIVPDQGAVERIGEALLGSACEEAVRRLRNFERDTAGFGIAVEGLGE